MRVYFGLNVDTGCPKLLHSPNMHEAVKPSLNRNLKKMTAFPLGILIVSLAVLSSACGGLRSASPDLPRGVLLPGPVSPASSLSHTAQTAPDTSTSDPSSVGLQTRVEEYWQARIQGDAQRTLEYEQPDQRKRLGNNIHRARFSSGLGVHSFVKVSPIVALGDDVPLELTRAASAIARAEGFTAHAEAAEIREELTGGES